MRPYVDHLLALLPFEPEAHLRLGGPPCTYVGHPVIERIAEWRSLDPSVLGKRLEIEPGRPVLVVLPGSRASEVGRLMKPFGEAIAILGERGIRPEVIIPAVPHVRRMIDELSDNWTIVPHLIDGEADKVRAFRLARGALAASGSVTLELAAIGTPMVVAYRVDALAAQLRFLVKTPAFALANLILGEKAFPELMQENCVPDKLADALTGILVDGPIRDRQLRALARIPGLLEVAHATPSDKAAEVVLGILRQRA
jgi:lipid-A-disaccharide synthase